MTSLNDKSKAIKQTNIERYELRIRSYFEKWLCARIIVFCRFIQPLHHDRSYPLGTYKKKILYEEIRT